MPAVVACRHLCQGQGEDGERLVSGHSGQACCLHAYHVIPSQLLHHLADLAHIYHQTLPCPKHRCLTAVSTVGQTRTNCYHCCAACLQAALGLGGSNNGAATAGTAGTIPVGDPTAADTTYAAAKKRMAVAADNQDATNITSYAKPDFVKQLIRECNRAGSATGTCTMSASDSLM
jgi:hypothetical protein